MVPVTGVVVVVTGPIVVGVGGANVNTIGAIVTGTTVRWIMPEIPKYTI